MLRLASDTSPNLMLMNYDLARFAVTDLGFPRRGGGAQGMAS